MSSMLKQATAKAKNVQVSICVPCRDMVHSAFAFDLSKLIQYSQSIGIDVIPHFCMGTLIVNQRDQLADMVLEAGSTHALWLDSDMMFPPDTIQRLLNHNKSIVAGNYVTRQYPHKTVAYSKLHDWRSYLINNTDTDLVEVEAVGMGCMLTDATVLKQMSKPYFQTVWIAETQDHMGEDFYFCKQAKVLGHTVWIDTNLSEKLSHLGTFAFTHDLVKSGLV